MDPAVACGCPSVDVTCLVRRRRKQLDISQFSKGGGNLSWFEDLTHQAQQKLHRMSDAATPRQDDLHLAGFDSPCFLPQPEELMQATTPGTGSLTPLTAWALLSSQDPSTSTPTSVDHPNIGNSPCLVSPPDVESCLKTCRGISERLGLVAPNEDSNMSWTNSMATPCHGAELHTSQEVEEAPTPPKPKGFPRALFSPDQGRTDSDELVKELNATMEEEGLSGTSPDPRSSLMVQSDRGKNLIKELFLRSTTQNQEVHQGGSPRAGHPHSQIAQSAATPRASCKKHQRRNFRNVAVRSNITSPLAKDNISPVSKKVGRKAVIDTENEDDQLKINILQVAASFKGDISTLPPDDVVDKQVVSDSEVGVLNHLANSNQIHQGKGDEGSYTDPSEQRPSSMLNRRVRHPQERLKQKKRLSSDPNVTQSVVNEALSIFIDSPSSTEVRRRSAPRKGKKRKSTEACLPEGNADGALFCTPSPHGSQAIKPHSILSSSKNRKHGSGRKKVRFAESLCEEEGVGASKKLNYDQQMGADTSSVCSSVRETAIKLTSEDNLILKEPDLSVSVKPDNKTCAVFQPEDNKSVQDSCASPHVDGYDKKMTEKATQFVQDKCISLSAGDDSNILKKECTQSVEDECFRLHADSNSGTQKEKNNELVQEEHVSPHADDNCGKKSRKDFEPVKDKCVSPHAAELADGEQPLFESQPDEQFRSQICQSDISNNIQEDFSCKGERNENDAGASCKVHSDQLTRQNCDFLSSPSVTKVLSETEQSQVQGAADSQTKSINSISLPKSNASVCESSISTLVCPLPADEMFSQISPSSLNEMCLVASSNQSKLNNVVSAQEPFCSTEGHRVDAQETTSDVITDPAALYQHSMEHVDQLAISPSSAQKSLPQVQPRVPTSSDSSCVKSPDTEAVSVSTENDRNSLSHLPKADMQTSSEDIISSKGEALKSGNLFTKKPKAKRFFYPTSSQIKAVCPKTVFSFKGCDVDAKASASVRKAEPVVSAASFPSVDNASVVNVVGQNMDCAPTHGAGVVAVDGVGVDASKDGAAEVTETGTPPDVLQTDKDIGVNRNTVTDPPQVTDKNGTKTKQQDLGFTKFSEIFDESLIDWEDWDCASQSAAPPDGELTSMSAAPPDGELTSMSAAPPDGELTSMSTAPPDGELTPKSAVPPNVEVTSMSAVPPDGELTPKSAVPPDGELTSMSAAPPDGELTSQSAVPPDGELTSKSAVPPNVEVTSMSAAPPDGELTSVSAVPPDGELTSMSAVPPDGELTSQSAVPPDGELTSKSAVPPDGELTSTSSIPPYGELNSTSAAPPDGELTSKTCAISADAVREPRTTSKNAVSAHVCGDMTSKTVPLVDVGGETSNKIVLPPDIGEETIPKTAPPSDLSGDTTFKPAVSADHGREMTSKTGKSGDIGAEMTSKTAMYPDFVEQMTSKTDALVEGAGETTFQAIILTDGGHTTLQKTIQSDDAEDTTSQTGVLANGGGDNPSSPCTHDIAGHGTEENSGIVLPLLSQNGESSSLCVKPSNAMLCNISFVHGKDVKIHENEALNQSAVAVSGTVKQSASVVHDLPLKDNGQEQSSDVTSVSHWMSSTQYVHSLVKDVQEELFSDIEFSQVDSVPNETTDIRIESEETCRDGHDDALRSATGNKMVSNLLSEKVLSVSFQSTSGQCESESATGRQLKDVFKMPHVPGKDSTEKGLVFSDSDTDAILSDMDLSETCAKDKRMQFDSSVQECRNLSSTDASDFESCKSESDVKIEKRFNVNHTNCAADSSLSESDTDLYVTSTEEIKELSPEVKHQTPKIRISTRSRASRKDSVLLSKSLMIGDSDSDVSCEKIVNQNRKEMLHKKEPKLVNESDPDILWSGLESHGKDITKGSQTDNTDIKNIKSASDAEEFSLKKNETDTTKMGNESLVCEEVKSAASVTMKDDKQKPDKVNTAESISGSESMWSDLEQGEAEILDEETTGVSSVTEKAETVTVSSASHQFVAVAEEVQIKTVHKDERPKTEVRLQVESQGSMISLSQDISLTRASNLPLMNIDSEQSTYKVGNINNQESIINTLDSPQVRLENAGVKMTETVKTFSHFSTVRGDEFMKDSKSLHKITNLLESEADMSEDTHTSFLTCCKTDTSKTGFSTASGKEFSFDPRSLQKATALLETDLNISEMKYNMEDNHILSENVCSMDMKHAVAGFSTASGKKFNFDKKSLQKATALLETDVMSERTNVSERFSKSDENVNSPNICRNVVSGFSTASGKKFNLDPKSLYKATTLLETDVDMSEIVDKEKVMPGRGICKTNSHSRRHKTYIDIADVTTSCIKLTESNLPAFATASGKDLFMNKDALVKTQTQMEMEEALGTDIITPKDQKFNRIPDQSSSKTASDSVSLDSCELESMLEDMLKSKKSTLEKHSKYGHPQSEDLNLLSHKSLKMKKFEDVLQASANRLQPIGFETPSSGFSAAGKKGLQIVSNKSMKKGHPMLKPKGFRPFKKPRIIPKPKTIDKTCKHVEVDSPKTSGTSGGGQPSWSTPRDSTDRDLCDMVLLEFSHDMTELSQGCVETSAPKDSVHSSAQKHFQADESEQEVVIKNTCDQDNDPESNHSVHTENYGSCEVSCGNENHKAETASEHCNSYRNGKTHEQDSEIKNVKPIPISSASGKSVTVSVEALMSAKSLMDDGNGADCQALLEEELFRGDMSSQLDVGPAPAALERNWDGCHETNARDEQDMSGPGRKTADPELGVLSLGEFGSADVVLKGAGFKTASGRQMCLSKEALKHAKAFWNDLPLSDMKDNAADHDGRLLNVCSEQDHVVPNICHSVRKDGGKDTEVDPRPESTVASSTSIDQVACTLSHANQNLVERDISDMKMSSNPFQTASGKVVSVSLAALNQARKVMSECGDVAEVPEVPSVENVSYSSDVKDIEATKKDEMSLSSLFQTASGKGVTMSESALSAAKKTLMSESSLSTVKKTLSENFDSKPLSLFQTASGKGVTVSESSLSAAKKTLSENFDSKPLSFFQTASGKGVTVSESSLSAAKKTLSENFDSKPLSLFQTASGKGVTVSESSLSAAKKTLSENFDSKPLSLFQTASGKGVTVSESSLSAAKKTLSENFDSKPLSLFQTASGKEVTVSESSLSAAKKTLSENFDSKPLSLFQTASGKGVTVSESSLSAAKKTLSENFDSKPLSLFQTASGKGVTVSESSLSAAKKTLSENFDSKPLSLFQTASGKGVTVSESSLSAAKKTLSENFDSKPLSLFQTASRKGMTVSESSLSAAKKTLSENFDSKPLSLFQTASGKGVTVSESSLSAAKKTLSENFDSKPLSLFQTASGKGVTVSESSLSAAKKTLSENFDSKPLSLFQTASGKGVTVSESSLSAAKKTLSENFDSKPLSLFQTASGKGVTVSESSLSAAKKTLSENFDSKPLSLFQTASGKGVTVEKQSLPKAKKLIKDTHETQLSTTPSTSLFETASGKSVTVSESALVKSKELFTDEHSKETSLFKTASGNSVSVSSNSLDQAKSLFNESVDDTCTESICSSNTILGSNVFSEHKAPQRSHVFQTASGSTVGVSKNALFGAQRLLQDNNSSTVLSKSPFQTASGSGVGVSTEALAQGRRLLGEVQEPPTAMVTSGHGFQTASGRGVLVSESSLESSMKLLDEASEDSVVPELEVHQAESHDQVLTTDGQRRFGHRSRSKTPMMSSPESTHLDRLAKGGRRLQPIMSMSLSTPPRYDLDAIVNKSSEKRTWNTTSSFKTPYKNTAFVTPVCKARDQDKHTPGNSSKTPVFYPRASLRANQKRTRHSPTNHNRGRLELDSHDVLVINPSSTSKKYGSENDNTDRTLPSITSSWSGDDISNRVSPVTMEDRSGNAVSTDEGCQQCESVDNDPPRQNPGCGGVAGEGLVLQTVKISSVQMKETAAASIDLKHKLEEAREKQREIIQKKKEQKVRPSCGRLFIEKQSAGMRLQYRDLIVEGSLSDQELCSMGVRQEIADISSNSAEDFRFNLLLYYPNMTAGVLVGDGAHLLPDNSGFAGKEEFYRSFISQASVDPALVSDIWVYNHYRWIVWKLAAYETSYPAQFSGRCLTPNNTMFQLKFRYDREVDRCHRSALKKIVERDDAACKRLVLCVSRIKVPQSGPDSEGAGQVRQQCEVELTDGWYCIKGQLDVGLAELVATKKISVGQKICVSGGELTGSQEACPPLEIPESLYLKICLNSTRPAPGDSKLGYQRDPRPLCVPISTLHSEGGMAGCVDVVVTRIYPVMYMEKLVEGGTVFRTEEAEEQMQRQFDRHKQDKMEKLYAQIQAGLEKEMGRVRRKSRKRWSQREVEDLQTGQEIYDAVEGSLQPEEVHSWLSEHQAQMMDNHRRYLQDLQHQQLQDKLHTAWEEAQQGHTSRNVTPVLKLRVSGCAKRDVDAKISSIVTVWRPNPEWLHLVEGKRYKIYGLVASSARTRLDSHSVHLTANRQTKLQPRPVNENYLDLVYDQREVWSVKDLRSRSPPFKEFDFVGMVITTKSNSQRSCDTVYISDVDGEILSIRFWTGLQSFGMEDYLVAGKSIVATNLILKWSRGSGPVSADACSEVTRFSSTTKMPDHRKCLARFTSFKQVEKSKFLAAAWERLSEHERKSQPPQTHLATPEKYFSDLPSECLQKLFSPMEDQGEKLSKEDNSATPDPVVKKRRSILREKSAKLMAYGSPRPLSPISCPVSPALARAFKLPTGLAKNMKESFK